MTEGNYLLVKLDDNGNVTMPASWVGMRFSRKAGVYVEAKGFAKLYGPFSSDFEARAAMERLSKN